MLQRDGVVQTTLFPGLLKNNCNDGRWLEDFGCVIIWGEQEQQDVFTVIRPFIERFGYMGVVDVFLFIYLFSFLSISLIFYFVYLRPIKDPAPLKLPIRETHRYALRFSLTVLFVYLVWSDRLWPLLERCLSQLRLVVGQLLAFGDRFFG